MCLDACFVQLVSESVLGLQHPIDCTEPPEDEVLSWWKEIRTWTLNQGFCFWNANSVFLFVFLNGGLYLTSQNRFYPVGSACTCVVCVCVHVCMRVCVHACLYVCVCRHVCVGMHVFVTVYVCVHMCMWVCHCLCVFVCVHACVLDEKCVHVYMHVCDCVCVCLWLWIIMWLVSDWILMHTWVTFVLFTVSRREGPDTLFFSYQRCVFYVTFITFIYCVCWCHHSMTCYI